MDIDYEIIEALGESWASLDGKMEKFRAGKGLPVREQPGGHYAGYVEDARAMIENLDRRGFQITRKQA